MREAVAPVLEAGGGDVAFDADGTLWRGDAGEELLRLLAHQRLLPRWVDGGVYEEYERQVQADPAQAYAFAVQVMEGVAEAALRAQCERLFAERFEGRLFRWVRPLLAALEARGVRAWVVSASPVWAVRPGARALGVPEDRVLGVTCTVAGGTLTGQVQQPIPCGEGKVARLEERGCRPRLGVGNGELDLPMLRHCERALVVAPHQGPDNALVAEALRRRWPVVRG